MVRNLLLISVLITCFCLCAQSASAQQLEIEGGINERVVSTKVNPVNRAPSMQVIIHSKLDLSYDTNMGGIPKENIASTFADGMNVDTIYFYVDYDDPFNTSRFLIISADGFVAARQEVEISAKRTYRFYTVDESTGTEYSHLVESATKASESHKYATAAGFYRQALTAEDAPSDLSVVNSSIEVMTKCDEYSRYGKVCLSKAKGEKNPDKLEQYYSEAFKAFSGIKAYMSDDKYDVLLQKIEAAIVAIPIIIEGVTEDSANTAVKLQGVKIYGMITSSEKPKNAKLLGVTDVNGNFHIEFSKSEKSKYKYLLFDPTDIKKYNKEKSVNISNITNHTKLRVSLYK